MTDVFAMLKEGKEAVSTGQVVDQCSAEKKVEDPADELRGDGGITREGVAGRKLSSGRVDGRVERVRGVAGEQLWRRKAC